MAGPKKRDPHELEYAPAADLGSRKLHDNTFKVAV